MNYLAHAYLTFPEILPTMGNLMADFIKGNRIKEFPLEVQQGIQLHRFIDRYTDQHEVVREAQQVFRKSYPLSAGIFTDILFDHFLANHVDYFDDVSLRIFTRSIYSLLQQHEHFYDDNMRLFFSYMEQYNWLYGYKSEEGIEKSIRGICRRYPRLGSPDLALELFKEHYAHMASCFSAFFPELIKASQTEFIRIKQGTTL